MTDIFTQDTLDAIVCASAMLAVFFIVGCIFVGAFEGVES